MKILAINFGHDASLALFKNNQLFSFLELERITRLKHTVGIKRSDIEAFVRDNNLTLDDINFIALSGTQWYKAKHDASITIEPVIDITDFSQINDCTIKNQLEVGGTDKWYDYESHKERLGDISQTAFPLDALSQDYSDYESYVSQDTETEPKAYKDVIPYRITMDDVSIPAIFVPHHITHAAYAAFYRDENCASQLIISHDGGWPHIPYNSGGLFLYKNEKLFPLMDPGLFFGQLYQIMGERAGFKPAEAPGKLMGLASYGIPYESTLIQLRQQLDAVNARIKSLSVDEFHAALIELCDLIENNAQNIYIRQEADEFEYQFTDRNKSIGIAAYTQKLVEQSWAESVSLLVENLTNQFSIDDELTVVGGFSLNCPANSLLQANLSSTEVKLLPGGSDMGTAIGAGAYVASLISEKFPVDQSSIVNSPAFPPRPENNNRIEKEISLKKIELDNVLEFYAKALVEGKIFCHVEKDSEVGPRALGHRSIIAHAANPNVRDHINQRKGREMWRPLAPIVRKSDFTRFFAGPDSGAMSQYMLATYRVKDKTAVPAVTHVDNTARAQMVESGTIHDLLSELNKIDDVPVIVNTSFNVAGEPLVETVEQAINSFEKLQFDYLYLNGDIYESPSKIKDTHNYQANNINIFYQSNQNGGGMHFGQDYLNVISERYNRKFNKIYEFCSGPGYIGFSLLGAGYANELILSDVHEPLNDSISKTIQQNKLDNRVKFYNVNGVSEVPETGIDLVVSNPPHFLGVQDWLTHIDDRIYIDHDWQIHREFYRNIASKLSDDGIVLFQENALGSSLEDFESMIEEGGLEITDCFAMKNTVGKDKIYYIESKRATN